MGHTFPQALSRRRNGIVQVHRARAFMPSSSFSTTSDGTPRMVEVTGATVTVDKYAMALLRVSHKGGSFLVWRGKLVKPNFTSEYLISGYSSGHVASNSQPRASASAGECRE